MVEVNLKNLQGERSDQENEEDGSNHSKIGQRVTQQDKKSPKRGKSLKKRKTRKRRRTSSSFKSSSPPRRRKERSKKQSKKSEGEDLLVRLHLYCLLIP